MIKKIPFVFIVIGFLFAAGYCKKHSNSSGGHSSLSEAAEVFIISPADGETVSGMVTVKFGIKGMEVAPAGTDKPHSGHHHLLIDVNDLPDLSLPIPADERHRHFGKGQTDVNLVLAPGKHTLQLILGDKDHVPHNPPVISKKITITVR